MHVKGFTSNGIPLHKLKGQLEVLRSLRLQTESFVAWRADVHLVFSVLVQKFLAFPVDGRQLTGDIWFDVSKWQAIWNDHALSLPNLVNNSDHNCCHVSKFYVSHNVPCAIAKMSQNVYLKLVQLLCHRLQQRGNKSKRFGVTPFATLRNEFHSTVASVSDTKLNTVTTPCHITP